MTNRLPEIRNELVLMLLDMYTDMTWDRACELAKGVNLERYEGPNPGSIANKAYQDLIQKLPARKEC